MELDQLTWGNIGEVMIRFGRKPRSHHVSSARSNYDFYAF